MEKCCWGAHSAASTMTTTTDCDRPKWIRAASVCRRKSFNGCCIFDGMHRWLQKSNLFATLCGKMNDVHRMHNWLMSVAHIDNFSSLIPNTVNVQIYFSSKIKETRVWIDFSFFNQFSTRHKKSASSFDFWHDNRLRLCTDSSLLIAFVGSNGKKTNR